MICFIFSFFIKNGNFIISYTYNKIDFGNYTFVELNHEACTNHKHSYN
jgi:hypothetical protein